MPRFADVRDQDRALSALRRLAGGERLPHAFIFHGPRGVGKTTAALALGQFLNCERPSGGDSCGECRTCHLYAGLKHPDLHWYFPMAGTEEGVRLKAEKRWDHVQKIKGARLTEPVFRLEYAASASLAIGRDEETYPGSMSELRHHAGMAAVEGKVKIFVVSDADRMTQEAANSLLKLLEEPLAGNLFILCTARPGAIPGTIESRCRLVRFGELSPSTIEAGLAAWIAWENERREEHNKRVKKKENLWPPVAASGIPLAAALAQGSLARAVDYLDKDVVAARNAAHKFFHIPPGDPAVHAAVEYYAGGDRTDVRRLLDLAALWLGDLLRASAGSDLPLANRDREPEIRAEAAALTPGEIRRRLRTLDQARRSLEGNVMPLLLLHELHAAFAGEGAAVR